MVAVGIVLTPNSACKSRAASQGPPPPVEAPPVEPHGDDAQRSQGHWVATWASSPQRGRAFDARRIADRTLRELVRVSLGGQRLRLRLSNAYGPTPLRLRAVHVALARDGASIEPGSDRALTFGGATEASVPAGGSLVSDPVSLDVPTRGRLALSLYVRDPTSTVTEHATSMQTTYISSPGDRTADEGFLEKATLASWFFVEAVDVEADENAATVVAFGDSITDGLGSTLNRDHRWPDDLAARLEASKAAPRAVVNEGISGNRLLRELGGESALVRFDRDVLARAGAKVAVVLLGINDIAAHEDNEVITPDVVIGALRQLVTRGHTAGLTVLGGTILPCEGDKVPGFYTAEGERTRTAVNAWIRADGNFDGVVDFDRAVRDPTRPTRLARAFDSGDRIHPNDAGYEAMAQAVDLGLLGAGR